MFHYFPFNIEDFVFKGPYVEIKVDGTTVHSGYRENINIDQRRDITPECKLPRAQGPWFPLIKLMKQSMKVGDGFLILKLRKEMRYWMFID